MGNASDNRFTPAFVRLRELARIFPGKVVWVDRAILTDLSLSRAAIHTTTFKPHDMLPPEVKS